MKPCLQNILFLGHLGNANNFFLDETNREIYGSCISLRMQPGICEEHLHWNHTMSQLVCWLIFCKQKRYILTLRLYASMFWPSKCTIRQKRVWVRNMEAWDCTLQNSSCTCTNLWGTIWKGWYHKKILWFKTSSTLELSQIWWTAKNMFSPLSKSKSKMGAVSVFCWNS